MMEFTDEEIREELARLGYHNVPTDKLNEFKKDLLKLIQAEKTSGNSSVHSDVEEEPQDVTTEEDFSPPKNFSNHGSQWIDKGYKQDWEYTGIEEDNSPLNYREDWEYKGEKARRDLTDFKSHERVTKSAGIYRKDVPGSYSLHEMPIEVEDPTIQEHRPTIREERLTSVNNSNIIGGEFSTSPRPVTQKMTKRKTCRPLPCGATRIEESFTESETDDIFNLYQKIKSMAVRDCECGKTRKTSGETEPPYRQKPGKRKITPSYIRKPLPPHVRNIKKHNPFNMLDTYRQGWKKHPCPGEAERKDVFMKIHRKMLQKEEIKLDNKVFVPNTFVIPSDKARMTLRWKVRTALENYKLPEHLHYHDI